LIADYTAETVGAICRFFDGLNTGMYRGLMTLPHVTQAIWNDPQLILHLSTDIMNTLTDGPGATAAAGWRGMQRASNALNHFLLTMATGTPEDRGSALGELGGNLITATLTQGASQAVAVSLTAVAGSMARNEALGTAISQALRGSEALAPQMAAMDATVAEIVSSARRLGIAEADIARVVNKCHHIFGPEKIVGHKLGGFLGTFGGDQIRAFKALEDATQMLANQRAIGEGFETTVTVRGAIVTVRGRVVNGIAKIGTAFIP
jgi:hypothetical protein